MIKNELRKYYKNKRNSFTYLQLNYLSHCILNNFISLNLLQSGHKICSFLPIQNSKEFNSYLILDYSLQLGAVPILTKSDLMNKTMRVIRPKDFLNTTLNRLGIPEPNEGEEINVSEVDIFIIPLICFDSNGHRVGYGGGYYDRLLNSTKGIKVGISLFNNKVQIDDINEYDIKLDYCITPLNIYNFEQ